MDWNLLKSLIKKYFIKQIIYLKVKNTSHCCLSHQITTIVLYVWPTHEIWSFDSHKNNVDPRCKAVRRAVSIVTPGRVLLPHPDSSETVELRFPDGLQQHLCFHFQFYQLQSPIWRLSGAIVSLCMQIFQLFTLLRFQPCTLLLGCRLINNSLWLLSFITMIKRWAVASLCVVYKLGTRVDL